MNENFIESYEDAMNFCHVFCPNALSNVENNNQNNGYFGLDEEDIERIQEILNDSDDDSYDDDDIIFEENNNEFPMPKKSTNNNSN